MHWREAFSDVCLSRLFNKCIGHLNTEDTYAGCLAAWSLEVWSFGIRRSNVWSLADVEVLQPAKFAVSSIMLHCHGNSGAKNGLHNIITDNKNHHISRAHTTKNKIVHIIGIAVITKTRTLIRTLVILMTT